MFNMSIPEISTEELLKRYSQIKPVIRVGGKLRYMREFTPAELTGISYIWKRDEDVREEVGKDELEVLEGKDFACLHGYGYFGLFKPSIGEVLAQISEDVRAFAAAFEIIESPETVFDFHKDSFTSIAFKNGYHVSTVRLYRRLYRRK